MKRKICSRKNIAAAAGLALSLCMITTALPWNVFADEESSGHEPLTIMTVASTDYNAFEEALKKAYPEVNLEMVSYKGLNSTEWYSTLLKAGDICDLFVITSLPSDKLQQANLYDLSGEDFTSGINAKMLSDVAVDGAVYLLPTNMSIFGIYYNKTLFEEHGWELPDSTQELRDLIPEIEEAGVTLSECATQYAGSCFSYFFDINAPEYITSLEGLKWMEDYTAGVTPATGNLEGCLETFQSWIDMGMLNIGDTPAADADTLARFKEGNTAFYVSNTNMDFYENEDGTGDEYGLMPYLSEDGTNNIVVTNVNLYFGVSQALSDNPQKLEDALKVMSFIASEEGQESLNTKTNTVSPLKSGETEEDSPIANVAALVDEGKSMPLIYTGWEDYVVEIGESCYKLIDGTMTNKEFLTTLDELQKTVAEAGGIPTLAAVEEDLSKEQTAELVGAAFAQAVDADCALISVGDYHGAGLENPDGVNASIYAKVPMNVNVVSTFNPLGWSKTIQTMTLTGAQIKEYAEEGYYYGEDKTPFAYVLVTKDGEELKDESEYTVACVTESEERIGDAGLTDTGIVGQDALTEYIESLGTLNSNTVLWK